MARRTVVRPNPAGMAALHNHIARIHASVVHDVFVDARDHAPVETGEMRSTMHVRHLLLSLSSGLLPLLSHVVVDSDHWQPVEYGASPHEIRPKTPGGALFWPGAPHPVTVVHHPGNEAQPFMRPALYQKRSLAGRP